MSLLKLTVCQPELTAVSSAVFHESVSFGLILMLNVDDSSLTD